VRAVLLRVSIPTKPPANNEEDGSDERGRVMPPGCVITMPVHARVNTAFAVQQLNVLRKHARLCRLNTQAMYFNFT
jgi:uncharacterized protein (DUF2126 family)